MGQYSHIAHHAALMAEQEAHSLPCQHPANNIVYCFLLGVRNKRAETCEPTDNLLRSIKKAMQSLAQHTLRVYDLKSLEGVYGIGPKLAQMINNELFALYPPEKPSGTELERIEAARAQIKADEAAKKKRNAEATAPVTNLAAAAAAATAEFDANRRTSFPPSAPAPASNYRSSGGGAAAPAFLNPPFPSTTARTTQPSSTTAAAGRVPKPKKPYTPGIGTANYAFLLVLLQAQRGPEKLEYLTKTELMSRAEASGLSNKPIMGEPVPSGGFTNRNSRTFYNGWSNWKTLVSHGLVAEYSNPKKVKLTFEGLALAERLYRDAVTRGKVAPVAGVPVDGPLLYQLEAGPQGEAAVAAAMQAQAAAGLRPEALPSAALRPPSRNQMNGSSGAGGRGGSGSRAVAAPSATAAAAAAAAAMRRASGNSFVSPVAAAAARRNDDSLEIPLAERLQRGGGGRGATGGDCVYLDLAGDDDDDGYDNPNPRRRTSSHKKRRRVSDEHVAMMMEMGFSDKKARKALRRSDNIDGALDIITLISSEASTSDDEDEDALGPLPRAAAAAPAVPFQASQETANGGRGHIRGGSQPAQRHRIDPNSQSQQLPSQELWQDLGGPSGIGNTSAAGGGAGGAARPRITTSTRDFLRGTAPTTANNNINASRRASGGPSSFPPSSTTGLWIDSTNVRLPPLPYGRKFNDEYELVLLVDGREQYSRTIAGGSGSGGGRSAALQSHLTRMRSAGMVVEHRTLPIGDALWVARSRRNPSTEYVLDYVLERKSLTDLVASIRDSARYTTQKYFMKRSGLRHLYYLIEGEVDTLPVPKDVKTIKTAAARTEVQDGFRVLYTKGVQETFRLYQSLTEALICFYCDLEAPFSSASAQQMEPLLSFDEFKEHMKKSNQGATTLHDIWGRMLCEVPGLGPEAVTSILNAYPAPMNLWSAYRKALQEGIRNGRGGQAVAEELLVGLRSNGGRALGADKSRKVFQHLFMNGWNLS